MADLEQARINYLEFAYDEVDGSPLRSFQQRDVEDKLGLSDDRKRELRRDLVNRGLLADEGKSAYSLRLPAIHQVEEARLEAGREDEVDVRREHRGTFVRTLHELVDGELNVEIPLEEMQEELDMSGDAERRAREYLHIAGLIEVTDDAVRLTEEGADWVEGA